MVSLVDRERWAPLVGRVFIAFGRIERAVHESIRKWAGECVHKHFAGAGLSARIGLAKDLAKSQDATVAAKDAFCASLRQARNLARYRNLVAHNPVCLVLLQDSLDEPFLEAIAHNTDDSKYFSYEELAEIVDGIERCAEELGRNFIAFQVEKMDFESLQSFPGLPRKRS